MTQPGPKKMHTQAMFARIAHRYDLLNHLLSLGLDFYWWRQMARMAEAKPGTTVLDVAAGTGDSTIALSKRGAQVVSSDFTLPMIAIGADKIRRKKTPGIVLGSVGADAQWLPFKNSVFDSVAICYGIRNVQQRGLAYAEFLRVLKPGGTLVILEFSRPRWAWLRWLCDIYKRHVLPKIGGFISGDTSAYEYLVESISKFPNQAELADELEQAGLIDVEWRSLSFGIVALHRGKATNLN